MHESHFRCLSASRSLAMGCWRADGSLFDANDALLHLLGRSKTEVDAGRVSWPDFTPPEYAPLDAQALREIAERGECTPFRKEYTRSDGTRTPVLVGGVAFGNGCKDAAVFFAVELPHEVSVGSRLPASSVLVLTTRQLVICLLASHDIAQKQIAQLLDVSSRTVEQDKQRAANVLGLSTSAVTLWAAANREAIAHSVSNSPLLTKVVVDALEQSRI